MNARLYREKGMRYLSRDQRERISCNYRGEYAFPRERQIVRERTPISLSRQFAILLRKAFSALAALVFRFPTLSPDVLFPFFSRCSKLSPIKVTPEREKWLPDGRCAKDPTSYTARGCSLGRSEIQYESFDPVFLPDCRCLRPEMHFKSSLRFKMKCCWKRRCVSPAFSLASVSRLFLFRWN